MSTTRCEDLSEELVAYLDGEQPEDERARIDAHVATCLACRREIERLTKVRGWLQDLPRIEPAADFEERMWERLERDTSSLVRRRMWRPARWGIPALAAAAALALMFYSSTERAVQDSAAPGAPERVAERKAERAVVAQAPAPAGEVAAGKREETDLAATSLSPDDLPPELVEHPELFLRYPVVRRIDKLEHFEDVRRHGEGEPLGGPPDRSHG